MERYKQIFNESIPKTPAYWISPSGKVSALFGNEKHIEKIIDDPKSYGLDIEEIKAIYNTEGENLGDEGKAREKIILALIKKGWIRIRYYSRDDHYSVNIFKLTKKVKDYIQKWSAAMVENNQKYSQVVLDFPSSKISYSMYDLASDILFTEQRNIKQISLKVVQKFDEFEVKRIFLK